MGEEYTLGIPIGDIFQGTKIDKVSSSSIKILFINIHQGPIYPLHILRPHSPLSLSAVFRARDQSPQTEKFSQ